MNGNICVCESTTNLQQICSPMTGEGQTTRLESTALPYPVWGQTVAIKSPKKRNKKATVLLEIYRDEKDQDLRWKITPKWQVSPRKRKKYTVSKSVSCEEQLGRHSEGLTDCVPRPPCSTQSSLAPAPAFMRLSACMGWWEHEGMKPGHGNDWKQFCSESVSTSTSTKSHIEVYYINFPY